MGDESAPTTLKGPPPGKPVNRKRHKSPLSRLVWTKIGVLVLGIFVVAIALLTGFGFPALAHLRLRAALVVDSPDAKNYDKWADTENYKKEDALWLYVWMWNLTNPEVVLAGGVPNYQEVGPYRHLTYNRAVNTEFYDDGNEVSYVQCIATFEEKPDKDSKDHFCNMHNETITMLNPYFISASRAAGADANLLGAATSAMLDSVVGQFTGTAFQDAVCGVAAASLLPKAKSDTVARVGERAFLKYWANATEDDATYPQNMRVSVKTPSMITVARATAAWDSAEAYSFCNAETRSKGVYEWVNAALDDAAARSDLQKATGMTATQVDLVADWLLLYAQVYGAPVVLAKYGVSELVDTGYLQWGSGSVLGGSIIDGTSKSCVPEFAVWSERVAQQSQTISVNQCKLLFESNYSITTTANMASFVALVKAQNWQVVNARYGLSPQTAAALAQYISYVNTCMVGPAFQSALANGGGLVATRTAEQWLWGTTNGVPYPDPLLKLLGVSTPRKFFNNDTTAENAITRNSRLRRKTGKDDLDNINYVFSRNDAEYVQWGVPIRVEGHDGARWPPYEDHPKSARLQLWNDDYKRPVELVYYDAYTLDNGLETHRYYSPGTAREINATFYNFIEGLVNLTNLNNGVPLFSSLPHLSGGAEMWMSNFTSNMIPDEEKYTTLFGVHSFSGITVYLNQMTQLNVMYDDNTAALCNTYYPNVQSDLLYPLWWSRKKSPHITTKVTEKLQMVEAFVDGGEEILIIATTGGIVIIIIGGVLLIAWVAYKLQKRHNKAKRLAYELEMQTASSSSPIPEPPPVSVPPDTQV
eukprot:TRINITY_DN18374_c0_g1_i1.p1 TRINITY_DN18374_c0_g1~~TRINITY_DN18374_c0_g1_i1.p1  ORF type:complete len:814 (-),score=232.13 TRINITY_DN18374_c0_g1_i1:135-2576(-)